MKKNPPREPDDLLLPGEETATASPRCWGTVLWRMLVLLVLAGYGMWLYALDSREMPKPVLPDTKRLEAAQVMQNNQLHDLVGEAATLQQKIKTIEDYSKNLEDKIKAINQLPKQTTQTNSPADIAALTALQTSIGQLQAELDLLKGSQGQNTEVQARRMNLLAGIDTLEKKITSGATYSRELKAVAQSAKQAGLGNHPAFKTLSSMVKDGVPTFVWLTEYFSETAQAAVPVTLSEKKNASFTDLLRSRLGGIVSIRKTEVDEKDFSDEALITRAETMLRGGDVVAAQNYLSQLSSTPRAIMLRWSHYAGQYLAAHNAVTQLKTAVMGVPAPPAKADAP